MSILLPIKLIVGLQNPGPDYAQTRHNAGAWFVTSLSAQQNLKFSTDKKFNALLAAWPDRACTLMLPLSFMNHSGHALRAFCHFYRISPAEVLVAHDDLDLSVGRIKLKTGGGHGGHRGLRDIIAQLGSADFHRIRIGIGHPGTKEQVVDHVLAGPSRADRQQILLATDRALNVIQTIIAGDTAAAMNILNNEGTDGI